MTDKLRELLEEVQTVYEGKGMVVHPNSFDKLRMEVIKLDNVNRLQKEQIEKMKNWCNCKNYQECLIELAEQGKGMKPSECCVNCKKWELLK